MTHTQLSQRPFIIKRKDRGGGGGGGAREEDWLTILPTPWRWTTRNFQRNSAPLESPSTQHLSAKARPAERLVRRSVFGDGGAATGWGAVSERGARRAGGRGAVRGWSRLHRVHCSVAASCPLRLFVSPSPWRHLPRHRQRTCGACEWELCAVGCFSFCFVCVCFVVVSVCWRPQGAMFVWRQPLAR